MTPQHNEQFENALKTFDFEGMARAWHEGDMKWYAVEWQNFIERIRREQAREIMGELEKIKVLPELEGGVCAELVPLAGVGMYLQYEIDQKKHAKQVSDLSTLITERYLKEGDNITNNK